ncbi:MAG TPA: hypothetical protein DIU15_00415 [Deltaproteobacteria bacterium]|nr:hypothetical protein [Deltaproteobacteria bacterium]HCP44491.1 hypothetical protein [Deltaproteobacteria bacterium]
MGKKDGAQDEGFSLEGLKDTIEQSHKYADWIDAAQAKSTEFSPEVVAKVVADYSNKLRDIQPELSSQANDAQNHRDALQAQVVEMEGRATSVEAQVDELKLRHVIGELDDDEFEARETDARASIDLDDLAALRGEVESIDQLLEKAQALSARVAGEAPSLDAPAEPPSPMGEISFAEAPADMGDLGDAGDEVVEAEMVAEASDDDEAVAAEGIEAAAELVAEASDVEEVAEAPAEIVEAAPSDEVVDAEPAAAPEDDERSDMFAAEFGEEAEQGDEPPTEGVEEGASAEVEIAASAADVESAAVPEAVAEDDEWAVDGAEDAADGEVEDLAEASQDALATGMVDAQPDVEDDAPPVQADAEVEGEPPGEGTRLVVTMPEGEPVVYPFNGEVMSLGRGRNNDIQIKNDGKISRYHCRIFRRGDEYVVEDNKSSNGTLVNGKLVTRQRLDGGELVQLGETRVLFCM